MVAITSQNHSIDSSSVPRQAECPGKEHRPGPQRGHCIKMIHRLVYLMLEPICRTQEIGSSPQVPVNMKKGWNKHLTGEFIDIHRLFIRSHQNARYRFCSSHYGLCCKQHGFHNATWNPHPSNKTSATFDPIVSWSVKPRLHQTADTTGILDAVYAMYRNPPDTSLFKILWNVIEFSTWAAHQRSKIMANIS